MDNSNKHVIITGSTRGIGKAIAERLLTDGYQVTFTGKDEQRVEEALEGFHKPGRKVLAHVVDFANTADVKQFASEWNSPLYAIVNNAGICKTLNINDTKAEDPIEEVMAVNFFAPYYLTKGLLPHVVDGGRIVNISSQLGAVGREDYSAYCGSKHALNALTSVWAKELKKRRILVNSILPGWVNTEMTEIDLGRLAKENGLTYEEQLRIINEKLDLDRFTEAHEIASLVSFMLSSDANAVTGTCFAPNGPLH